MGKFIKPECTLVIARGWGKQRVGRRCSMGTGFYCGSMEMFWKLVVPHVLKDTELFTLKWLILCYMEFTYVYFFSLPEMYPNKYKTGHHGAC